MDYEISVELIQEAVDAHGLAYAIQTGALDANDIPDKQLSSLVKTASDTLRAIEGHLKY